MESILDLAVRALQILLFDIMLSGDNVGVIALATRKLPKEYAKKASIIGVSFAVGLRILFACIVVWIMAIQWLPIRLVGGILLVKITWDFIKPQEEDEHVNVKQSDKFWGAIISIVLADITMSLDNVLAIASAAKDSMGLIIFGLIFSIPILFFGSQFVLNLMQKYLIAVYIGGAVLAHTAVKMIFEDGYIARYVSHTVSFILPLLAGAAVILYGIVEIKKSKKPEAIEIFEASGDMQKLGDSECQISSKELNDSMTV